MKSYLISRWTQCLVFIKDNIGEERFKTWFECAKPVSYEDGMLTLFLPSPFYKEKYEDDLYPVLKAALRKVFGTGIRLQYIYDMVANDTESCVKINAQHQSPIIKNKLNSTFNQTPIEKREVEFDHQLSQSLNFENYCIGESNRLPVAIAESIANNPGKPEFNPFFLYGNVGVGKTHLVQAIGIRIKERNPRAKVLFIPVKQFQTLYANATMNKEIPAFINWFQQMDVILFDDLQELSGKIGTAEALFPIFNHLRQNKKNIIFTCDRPPMALDGIADRLIDRFKWGIVESLPSPDYQLRKKILKFKSETNGLGLTEEVMDEIATRIEGSVRELETIVTGLLLRATVKNAPITVELAREVMSNIVKTSKKVVNFDMIIEATAEYYNISPDAIFSQSRMREIVDARQMVMFLSRKHTGLSFPAIGSKLNRKHTTVQHGIISVKDRLQYSKELSEALTSIETDLLR